jgi:hypothetical protein
VGDLASGGNLSTNGCPARGHFLDFARRRGAVNPRPLRRLLSLVVATLFSATTITLPFADAVLDHLRPVSATRHADHLEGPGGCGAHAEHCLVSSTTATLPAHPAQPAVHLGGTATSGGAASVERTNPTRPLPPLPPSRAPPALPA